MKSKHGCITCRIRKVKCDEHQPVCHRCKSTGRFCDGYGIWGGGDSFHSHRRDATGMVNRRVAPLPLTVVSVPSLKSEELGYLEWFKCRTAVKLPGGYASHFWDTLLFQASTIEPAVLHAVLALSSIHKTGMLAVSNHDPTDTVVSSQEQFTLKHYDAAIKHLQPHFSAKNAAASRVAAITCIAFICRELLRGHFTTAQTLLQTGIRLLLEMQLLSATDPGFLCSKPGLPLTDHWIVEVLSRLHLQVEILRYTYRPTCLIIHTPETEPAALALRSIRESWQHLERLLNKLFLLARHARRPETRDGPPFQIPPLLLERQQQLRLELDMWLGLFTKFQESRHGRKSAGEEKVYTLLHAYHTMTRIMTDTCLHRDTECTFDDHTSSFIGLVTQLTKLRTMTSTIFTLQAGVGDMSRSIIDLGWIAPLYYVAIKCRVHRIRLQAIRLLESTSHREGIWDATIAARICRKVMQVEEKEFYKGINIGDDFSLASAPCLQDLSLPMIPPSYRLAEVEFVVPGNPAEKILLFYQQGQARSRCRTLLAQYDLYSRCWTDAKCG